MTLKDCVTQWDAFTWGILGKAVSKMGRQVVDITVARQSNEPWGLRIVGGADVASILKVMAGKFN